MSKFDRLDERYIIVLSRMGYSAKYIANCIGQKTMSVKWKISSLQRKGVLGRVAKCEKDDCFNCPYYDCIISSAEMMRRGNQTSRKRKTE